MATLENIDGSSLVPDILGVFNRQRVLGQQDKALEQQDRALDIEGKRLDLSGIELVQKLDGPLGKAVAHVIGNGNITQMVEMHGKATEARNFYDLLSTSDNSEKTKSLLIDQARILRERGDLQGAQELLAMTEMSKEQQDLMILKKRMTLGNAEEALSQAEKKQAVQKQTLLNQVQFINRLPLAEQAPALQHIINEKVSKGEDPRIFEDLIRTLGGVDRNTKMAAILSEQGPGELIKAKAGDVFLDQSGNQVFNVPMQAGGVDFAKPNVSDFTPESVAKASSPGGSVKDLVVRPEVLEKLDREGRFATGTNTLFKVGDKTFIGTPVTEINQQTKEAVTKLNLTELKGPKGTPGKVVSRGFGETGQEESARKIGESTETAQRKQSIAISKEAFDKLGPIDQSIENINRGIQAIDQGANTGPIISQLPSITRASIELDNVQAQMGLDVIGNTTFGALSDAELKFALSAALPKSLNEPDLRDWLIRKREAQTKLKNYLAGAASFFSQGGTIDEFIKQQKQLKKLRNTNSKDGESSNAGRFKVRVK